MERPSAYIPMDRRQALFRGKQLPNRVQGAALLADVSGFTPLTEALARALGPQLGAEQLTFHLNRVFDALIQELHQYGGCVISFAGDAITCWLDGDDGRRATACALAMQHAMAQFEHVDVPGGGRVSLAMKAAVAVGPARRFLVGDPEIQILDVLAGATLDDLATAEKLANKGEVVLSPAAVKSIRPLIELVDTRPDGVQETPFGVVANMSQSVPPRPWPELPQGAFTEEQVRPWLLPPVHDRLQSGQGEFLAELRPTVSLFALFSGIEYDRDEAAGSKLDEFVIQVQRILARYEGYLLHITFGDKGSYLSAAFGAPIAHEDDAVRAVAAATGLRSLPATLDYITELQFGIAAGRTRTGAYGGTMRRTYGTMGDTVNLSARLMQAAEADQILATQAISQATQASFNWEMLPDIKVKGKVEQIAVACLVGTREQQTFHLQEPRYRLPMVGREKELLLLQQKLAQVLQGEGQIIGVMGEAGIGKSRLVAEAVSLAQEQHFAGYGGECQSYATTTSYFVWQTVWRNFFELRPGATAEEQVSQLAAALSEVNPGLAQRLPLLGAVVNQTIPDNELTQSFDAKLRKQSLESLLVDCLQARAQGRPMFIVLEDCHWMDSVSNDLLEAIGRAISRIPVLVLLTYRTPDLQERLQLHVQQLPHFSEVSLIEFTETEARHLIRLKLNQLSGSDAVVADDLVSRIRERAGGNPFYIEELLNYLKDRYPNLAEVSNLRDLELPASLHSLILSRIDQLTESQKGTIKVASVIGRAFEAAMLWGCYPQLGAAEQIRRDLDELSRLDLTPLDRPEPELTYLFKNIVTQEVAYENLPFAMRAMLHELIAEYIEESLRESPDQYVDLLAYHYSRSNNEAKKREYLLRAGDIAQANYANEAALEYYERVLPLLPEGERVQVMLKLGGVLRLVGRWEEAGKTFGEALTLARKLGSLKDRAASQTAIGEHLRNQGKFEEAEARFERARTNYEELGDKAGVAKVLHEAGILAANRGERASARGLWELSLAMRRELGEDRAIASLLSNLGILARWEGDYQETRRLYEESLAIRQRVADKWGIAVSLNNLGFLELHYLDDLESARKHLEEAVALLREVGDRGYLAGSLVELANVARAEKDFITARSRYREGLLINQTLGDQRLTAYLLEGFSSLASLEGQAERAMRLYGAASALRERIGAPLPAADKERLEGFLGHAREILPDDRQKLAYERGCNESLEEATIYALNTH